MLHLTWGELGELVGICGYESENDLLCKNVKDKLAEARLWIFIF